MRFPFQLSSPSKLLPLIHSLLINKPSLLLLLYCRYLDTIDSANIHNDTSNVEVLKAIAGINFTVRIIADTTTDLNDHLARRPDLLAPCSPVTPYSAYHCLKVLSSFEHVIPDADQRFHDVYSSLHFFAKRWGVAGMSDPQHPSFRESQTPLTFNLQANSSRESSRSWPPRTPWRSRVLMPCNSQWNGHLPPTKRAASHSPPRAKAPPTGRPCDPAYWNLVSMTSRFIPGANYSRQVQRLHYLYSAKKSTYQTLSYHTNLPRGLSCLV